MPRHVDVRPPDDEVTVLVGLVTAGSSRSVVDDHLDELERLVDTAGGRVVERGADPDRLADGVTLGEIDTQPHHVDPGRFCKILVGDTGIGIAQIESADHETRDESVTPQAERFGSLLYIAILVRQ